MQNDTAAEFRIRQKVVQFVVIQLNMEQAAPNISYAHDMNIHTDLIMVIT